MVLIPHPPCSPSSITATRSLLSFSGLAVGRYLAIRVRAVGVRGPGAWTDVLTARVL